MAFILFILPSMGISLTVTHTTASIAGALLAMATNGLVRLNYKSFQGYSSHTVR